jgi:hypothetical protein
MDTSTIKLAILAECGMRRMVRYWTVYWNSEGYATVCLYKDGK